MDVLREVNAAFPDLTFDLTVKVEHILEHRDLWSEACSPETWCSSSRPSRPPTSEVLDVLDKGHTVSEMAEATRVTRRSRHPAPPFVDAVHPSDPSRAMSATSSTSWWISDLLAGVDPVQLSIRLLIPDGSLILESEMAPFMRDYDPGALSYPGQPGTRMVDELQARTGRRSPSRVEPISEAPSRDVVSGAARRSAPAVARETSRSD